MIQTNPNPIKRYFETHNEIFNIYPQSKTREVSKWFNLLLLKDNQFIAMLPNSKYFLVTF